MDRSGKFGRCGNVSGGGDRVQIGRDDEIDNDVSGTGCRYGIAWYRPGQSGFGRRDSESDAAGTRVTRLGIGSDLRLGSGLAKAGFGPVGRWSFCAQVGISAGEIERSFGRRKPQFGWKQERWWWRWSHTIVEFDTSRTLKR